MENSSICILPLKAIKVGESAEPESSSIYQVVWSDRKLMNQRYLFRYVIMYIIAYLSRICNGFSNAICVKYRLYTKVKVSAGFIKPRAEGQRHEV